MKDRPRTVVLLRHGIAEPRESGTPDESRALTKYGKRRMRETAKGLARLLPKAPAIYSSPLLRCVQTAKILAKAYGGKVEPVITEALAPGASPRELRALLDATSERCVYFVGHEPGLTAAMLDLTNLSCDGELELKKGGCYAVRIVGEGGELRWMLSPRALR
jgi:phosphohistidine phosphatase